MAGRSGSGKSTLFRPVVKLLSDNGLLFLVQSDSGSFPLGHMTSRMTVGFLDELNPKALPLSYPKFISILHGEIQIIDKKGEKDKITVKPPAFWVTGQHPPYFPIWKSDYDSFKAFVRSFQGGYHVFNRSLTDTVERIEERCACFHCAVSCFEKFAGRVGAEGDSAAAAGSGTVAGGETGGDEEEEEVERKLKRLEKWVTEGLITEEEYKKKKGAVLKL